MRTFVAAAALLLVAAAGSASAGTTPAYQPDLTDLRQVPSVALPADTLAKAREAESKREARQFAVRGVVGAALGAGAWAKMGAERSRWRMVVESRGAYSMSVRLAAVRMPKGTDIYFYDTAGKLIQGPVREANDRGDIWSPVVLGDAIVVEAQVPSRLKADFSMVVADGFHGYRSFGQASKRGACNIDVACDEADPFSRQVRSVVMYTIDNQFVCTGNLINTADGSLQGLIMTATHCGLQFDSADGPTVDGVVLYYNYQTSACGSGEGTLNQTQTGGFLLTRDEPSDTSLFGMFTSPPPDYNAHFGGLNARPDAPLSGAVISHPSGDEKSIAFYNGDVYGDRVDIFGGGSSQSVDGWVVQYDAGTTEPGSSGAGLLNERGEIVGVLSGGDASCENPLGTDVFGRMDVAWEAGGDFLNAVREIVDPADECGGRIPGRDQTSGPASSPCESDAPDLATEPPVGTLTVEPNNLRVGDTATVRLVLTHLNGVALEGVSFNLQLEDGLTFLVNSSLGAGCGAQATALEDESNLDVRDVVIPAGGSCEILSQFVANQPGDYFVGLPVGAVFSAAGASAVEIGSTFSASLDDPNLINVTFTADRTQIVAGETVALSWNAQDAVSCVADGAWEGDRPTVGTVSFGVGSAGTYLFGLTCSSDVGSVRRVVTITAAPANGPGDPGNGGGDFFLDGPSKSGGSLGGGLLALLAGAALLRRRRVG